MRKQWQSEIDAIAALNDGCADPHAVVAWAGVHPESDLHRKFDWDDTSAGRKYRLAQARQLIRLHMIRVEPDGPAIPKRISLKSDRGKSGYRQTSDIVRNAVWREELLTMALAEMERVRARYEQYKTLPELTPIFNALDEVSTSRQVAVAAE